MFAIVRSGVALGSRELCNFRMQGHGMLHKLRRGCPRLVFDHGKLRLEEGPFFVNLQHLKTLDAACQNIHPAVVIALGYFDDFRSTTDFSDTVGRSPHHAEWFLFVQTLRNHFLVTRFEDVQRQGSARQQHQVQRKQRQ